MYSERFWKKNWDDGLRDLATQEFETTFVAITRKTFEEFPTRTALAYLGVDLTFGELDGLADQFANALIDNGFQKGDVVGIHLPNVPEYLITLIGTLRAGCVVSGVSPLLSPNQIQYQLNDLGAGDKRVALVTLDAVLPQQLGSIASNVPQLKLVVGTNVDAFLPTFKPALGPPSGKILSGRVDPPPGLTIMDFHRDLLAKYPKRRPDVSVTPDDLGYIQYTGGTTGPPKGAMLSNRNVASNLLSLIRWLGWDRHEGVLLSGFPMFHIAGLTIAECAACIGWPQLLIPNPRDTDHICTEMLKYGVTNLVNVPSLYQSLMANPRFRQMDFSRLSTCLCAASPFPKESQEELEAIIGKGKLLELYGMTETSPVSTMNPAKGKKKLGTVGLPFLNVDLKLIDPATGTEVPLGEPGEICVRGPMVMQGYYNKPRETSEAIDADGYMHTGDVACMDEEGYLRIVDRTKDMIIVGGYKVFSSKVEETIARHRAVAMIALVGMANPDRPGSEIVKALVQLDPQYDYHGNEHALKQDIIRFAKENCSPYEVPKIIEIIAEMPMTAVGKVDKKALRARGI